MEHKHNPLRLENQLCFPLYACSREIIKRYRPLLEPHGLTYTQYIALMVLWEQDGLTLKQIGDKLYLDSGTLTPLLKKMQTQGLLVRKRSHEDERNVRIYLTETGKELEHKLSHVPQGLIQCLDLSQQEAKALYHTLYKLLGQLKT